MRLSSISITGFGGVADRIDIDLSADVVIIVGANGYGKTTVCNAISWVLTGQHVSSEGPRNVYTSSGTTAVSLRLNDRDNVITISRSLENPAELNPKKHEWVLTVEVGSTVLRGAAAEHWIRVNIAGAEAEQDFDSVAESMVEAIYLRQESLRQFLTGREDTDRFAAVAEMVGAGRLQDFATQLDSHKAAWVRAVNKLEGELEPLQGRLEDLSRARNALSSEIDRAQSLDLLARWAEWCAAVRTIQSSQEDLPEAPALNEHTLTHLREVTVRTRSELAHRASNLEAVLAELKVEATPIPDEDEMRDVLQRTKDAEVAVQTALAASELSQGEHERLELAFQRNQSVRDDLASMATILLRHVSDTCAACGQSVDHSAYANRLNQIVSASERPDELTQVEAARVRMIEADEAARSAIQEHSQLQERSQRLTEQRAAYLATVRSRAARLRELAPIDGQRIGDKDIDLDVGARLVEAELAALRHRSSAIADLEQRGMEFESAASLDGARKRVSRLDAEIAAAGKTLAEKRAEVDRRRKVGVSADQLARLLKEDAENFVTQRIDSLQPLLAQFYAAIDPHPTFRKVQILTRQSYGKHRLVPILIDEDEGVKVTDPGRTLSTSQANALAVALFLSFNLGFSTHALTGLILDDPLQNLDDVHLLGLVDLLRKIAPHRQMIVTTHDQTLASLMARKLRPIGADSRTTIVRFTKWDRNGPGVEQIEVPTVEQPLMLVSA